MEVAGIILVGDSAAAQARDGRQEPEAASAAAHARRPLPLQPLLGELLVQRMVDVLRSQSMENIAVLSEFSLPLPAGAERASRLGLKWQQAAPGELWRAAENAFTDLVQTNVDEVIVIHMGGYMQLDVQDLISHHIEHRCRITSAVAPDGRPLHVYVASANRRNDAACLFRSRLEQTRTACKEYVFRGYVNPLRSYSDYRSLVTDALLQKIPITPRGDEVRPGIWVAPSASIDSTARLVAPVFIGEHARVLPGALVTRCAAIEHHSIVCQGAIVENATVLPYTRLGAGMELKHSVAAAGRIAHLRHGVEIDIGDPRLLAAVPESAFSLLLGKSADLWDSFSLRSIRDFFMGLSRKPIPGPSPSASARARGPSRPEPAEAREGEEFANVAVTRRYGNQQARAR